MCVCGGERERERLRFYGCVSAFAFEIIKMYIWGTSKTATYQKCDLVFIHKYVVQTYVICFSYFHLSIVSFNVCIVFARAFV